VLMIISLETSVRKLVILTTQTFRGSFFDFFSFSMCDSFLSSEIRII
jgi:hypothetical protein